MMALHRPLPLVLAGALARSRSIADQWIAGYDNTFGTPPLLLASEIDHVQHGNGVMFVSRFSYCTGRQQYGVLVVCLYLDAGESDVEPPVVFGDDDEPVHPPAGYTFVALP